MSLSTGTAGMKYVFRVKVCPSGIVGVLYSMSPELVYVLGITGRVADPKLLISDPDPNPTYQLISDPDPDPGR